MIRETHFFARKELMMHQCVSHIERPENDVLARPMHYMRMQQVFGELISHETQWQGQPFPQLDVAKIGSIDVERRENR